jgi:hypothetical protein
MLTLAISSTTIVFMNRVNLDSYICEALMRDLIGHDRKPSSFIVYLHLYYQTFGRRRRSCRASYSDLAEDTGLSRSAAQAAVKALLRRKLVGVRKDSPTAVPEYRVNRPWRRGVRE